MNKLDHDIIYYPNGNKKQERYYLNNKLHNEYGPAIIGYLPTGNKWYEHYYLNGNFHNKHGPAYISYNNLGNKTYESYHFHGKTINVNSLEEFKIYVKTLVLK